MITDTVAEDALSAEATDRDVFWRFWPCMLGLEKCSKLDMLPFLTKNLRELVDKEFDLLNAETSIEITV